MSEGKRQSLTSEAGVQDLRALLQEVQLQQFLPRLRDDLQVSYYKVFKIPLNGLHIISENGIYCSM